MNPFLLLSLKWSTLTLSFVWVGVQTHVKCRFFAMVLRHCYNHNEDAFCKISFNTDYEMSKWRSIKGVDNLQQFFILSQLSAGNLKCGSKKTEKSTSSRENETWEFFEACANDTSTAVWVGFQKSAVVSVIISHFTHTSTQEILLKNIFHLKKQFWKVTNCG